MSDAAHFDRRGSTYDASETHRRIIATLVGGAALKVGMRVLDVATGTGAAALKAAELVGVAGRVVGVDVSEGMLWEARRKVLAAGLDNVEFVQADAEVVDMPAESFDYVLCASGLVLMRDIPGALRRWAGWLRRGGQIAFEVPAKPFGLSELVAEVAGGYGIVLPYDVVGDTVAKCRGLLEDAGLAMERVETVVVGDDDVSVEEAVGFLEERMDHPAWRRLKEADLGIRGLVREGYVMRVMEGAAGGRVRSRVVQNFVYGRKGVGA